MVRPGVIVGCLPIISLSMEMSRLTRDGTAEPISRDQILRHARGQGKIHFPCSADHEQDWQPYPVDPYSAICDDHTYIPGTYIPQCHMSEVFLLTFLVVRAGLFEHAHWKCHRGTFMKRFCICSLLCGWEGERVDRLRPE